MYQVLPVRTAASVYTSSLLKLQKPRRVLWLYEPGCCLNELEVLVRTEYYR